MNDALIECYKLLGLSPGASPEEVKAAHRDLAKVWHPDRFLHDPRLQQKAQEKLKQINEAYDQLRSGKAKRQTSSPAADRERHASARKQTVNVGVAPRIRWPLILAPVLIFAVAFVVGSRSLLLPGERAEQSEVPAIGQSRDPQVAEQLQINTAPDESPEKDRTEIQSRTEESQTEEAANAATSQPIEASMRPLPTVTIMIDPKTGMLARSTCPLKSRMTYPSGNEPKQYCSAHPAATSASTGASSPKDSRLKTAAKRLVSPGKWFGKSDPGNPPEPKSP